MNDNTKPKIPGIILWFTGLSGAGKTTVAESVLSLFQKKKFHRV
jgi:adenylylsulfate kinase-like enzyme